VGRIFDFFKGFFFKNNHEENLSNENPKKKSSYWKNISDSSENKRIEERLKKDKQLSEQLAKDHQREKEWQEKYLIKIQEKRQVEEKNIEPMRQYVSKRTTENAITEPIWLDALESQNKITEQHEEISETDAFEPFTKTKNHADNNRCEFEPCGIIIEGIPFIGRDGKKYCAKHRIPESRGETGTGILPKEGRVVHSQDGGIQFYP